MCGALNPHIHVFFPLTSKRLVLGPNVIPVLCLPHLVSCHLALGTLSRLEPFVERSLDGLHLGGDGL